MQKNWKKVMAGALSVCLFATNAPEVIELGEVTHLCEVVQAATAKTYSGTCGEKAKWKYNTSTKTLTISGTGAMDDYTDPEEEWDEEWYEDFPISKCRPWEEYTETGIEKVVIGDAITRIGNYAFVYAEKLKEVKIGKSVEAIGENAFSSCSSLKKIALGDKVEKIEKEAFYYCSTLKEVKFGKAIKEIGASAFDKCTALQQATLGDDLQEIGEKAFFGCNKLKNIYFGKSLQNIENEAFYGCWGIENIKLHTENEYFVMDKNVLMNKENTELYLGVFADDTTCNVDANIEKIDRMIINHTKLERFEVSSENQKYYSEDGLLYWKDKYRLLVCPKGKKGTAIVSDKAVYMNMMSSDGEYDYEHEYEGESLYFNYNVKPFGDCAKLEKIIIGKNIKYLDGEFSGCTSLKEVEVDEENEYYSAENGSILNKDQNKLLYYIVANENGTYTMPSGVTQVNSSAFTNGTGTPKHIVLSDKLCNFDDIPRGVTEITLGKKYYNNGDLSWIDSVYAENLKRINVSKENSYYSSVDGILYTKDKKKLVKCPVGRSAKVSISNKTTTIGEKAFMYTKATKFVIPKTVKKIEKKAFSGVNKKSTIYVPKGKKKYYKKLLTSTTGFKSTMTIKEK